MSAAQSIVNQHNRLSTSPIERATSTPQQNRKQPMRANTCKGKQKAKQTNSELRASELDSTEARAIALQLFPRTSERAPSQTVERERRASSSESPSKEPAKHVEGSTKCERGTIDCQPAQSIVNESDRGSHKHAATEQKTANARKYMQKQAKTQTNEQ